jgi:two-component system KDP operon response regulator KdpE
MEKRKILIVDDNEDLLKALRIILRAQDYVTAVAADGVSAISQAKNEKPDLIVLDLGLPAGDGFKVMERLSNIDSLASIPVIVLSAKDAATNKERALKAGARVFLQKPPDNTELLASIKKLLKDHSRPVA